MQRVILYPSLSIFLLGAAALFLARDSADATSPSPAKAQTSDPSLIAAPGLVEPISEEIKVGSEIVGKLRQVRVEEGDHVQRGQIVAIVSNDDYRSRLASAEAELRLKEAELRRVVNGARTQERQEAWAAVSETEAVLDHARSERARREALYRSGDLARADYERAEREYSVAEARYQAARQHFSLIDAPPREEDRTRAESQVELARALVEEQRARLEKTLIRSPIAGVVFRRYLKTGESVKDSPEAPILSVGDPSIWRVRVDVDEADIDRIRLGQRAYVTADAFGNRKFWGRVVRIGQILGRKNVRTDEPTERVDRKILETLVELKEGQGLHAGLRVTAYVLVRE